MFCKRLTVLGLAIAVALANTAAAADWPMWRNDAGRSGYTSAKVPGNLTLQWKRELGKPAPAWPEEQDYHGKLDFDRAYQPIVLGGLAIVPSMASDRITAYETATGDEVWRFYADGPIRFAPVGNEGRVYFVSDDGHLYCVEAETGELQWKVRGGPDDRTLLGNQRLISAWPARGAPVLADDTVYFAAGIWPFMGIFLHAVDATTGETVWTNSGTGAIYNLHQHGGAVAFGGVAPQGYLAVSGDTLVVSGGLTVPALFDRKSGEFLAFQQAHNIVGKGSGGFNVAAVGDYYFNAAKLFSFEDGKPRLDIGSNLPVLPGDRITVLSKNELQSFGLKMDSKEVEVTDRRGRTSKQTRYSLRRQHKAKARVEIDSILMQAGDQVVVLLDNGDVAGIDNLYADDDLNVAWTIKSPGTVDHVLLGDDRLIVSTREGWLHCYGAAESSPKEHRLAKAEPVATDESKRILEQSGASAGVALVWGLEDGELVRGLLAGSDLKIVAVDDDAGRVEKLRRELDDAGLYGRRVHLLCAAPDQFPFPPYLAELVTSERLEGSGWRQDADEATAATFFKRLFQPLRPYGGAAWLPVSESAQTQFASQAATADLPKGKTERQGGFATLTREGALPGAGKWTHQYGSSANTVYSGDQLVKAPMGVLWFGGPTNQDALPRHGQGPIPQVVGGRLIIEGVNSISARCVYTGRTLWRREFPDIGFPYKSNNHSFTGALYINNQPGANFIGSNYVSLEDGVYAVYQDECHRLDPATGETKSVFRLPALSGDEPDSWGYIGVWDDYLVAGASPQIFDEEARIGEQNWNATSSERVVVMDRHTGEVLWSRKANYGFRHNAIVPVAGKLFLIDRLTDGALDLLARRGVSPSDRPILSAHDIKTGKELWSVEKDIFGTWLGYSEDHDILIQGGRTGGRQHLPDEPSKRVIAYRGADGKLLWDNPISYTGPLVILRDKIITSGRKDGGIDILTGELRNRIHPLTGVEVPWSHTRTYGCGTVLACDNLLTFRSGAAGFFDLGGDGGTGNFGGFRAGCTPNLIPADGVLNAPDYTRTCSCSYQNQTSLALIHTPEVETWTYSTIDPPKKGEAVRSVGVNLNAPGDRLADNGVWWIEYPSIAGPSPDIPIRAEKDANAATFRHHSSLLDASSESDGLAWVAGSGMEGPLSLKLTLHETKSPPEKTYVVRLHFAEPADVPPGERVFGVSLQGKKVEEKLDVVSEAGKRMRPLVRQYDDVSVTDALTIELHPTDGSLPPILSGIEVIEQGFQASGD